jgi:hypothetical protein
MISKTPKLTMLGYIALLWPPVFFSLFLCVLLFFPPQMKEVYRTLFERANWLRATLAFFSLGCSAYAITVAARAIVSSPHLDDPDSLALTENIFFSWFFTALGLLVPFAVAYALIKTASGVFVLNSINLGRYPILDKVMQVSLANAETARRLRMSAAAIVIVSVIAATLLRRDRQTNRLFARSYHADLIKYISRHWMTTSLVSFLAFIALSFLFGYSSGPASAIGTVPVLSLFTICAVLFFSSVRIGFHKSGLSPGMVLFALAFFFSVFGWNNNHLEPRVRIGSPKDLWNAGGPQRAFEEWFLSRGDKNFFDAQKKPYPVFIIAAQGGGVYAAGQAALFLSRMQDRCPNFAEHIFAISSVSGGSIGSAFFASLPSELIPNQPWLGCRYGDLQTGPLEERARAFIGSDLLSPVIAAALFPDLLQRFLPFTLRFTDRGKALDGALARAWSSSQQTLINPFDEMFLERWQPISGAPALIINSTDVKNGRRVLISPFAINPLSPSSDSQQSWLYETPEMRKSLTNSASSTPAVEEDLRLGQAVGISARFPWILPAAEVKRGEEILRLVDGGYFDNSGIESALDLIEALIPLRDSPPQNMNFEIHLITFTAFQYDAPSSWTGLDDLLSPVRALLSSRESRGAMSYERAAGARFFECGYHPNCPPPPYYIYPAATLDQQDLTLALALQMSSDSLNLIQAEVGDPSKCSSWGTSGSSDNKLDRLVDHTYSNSCVACTVHFLLSGLTLELSGYPCVAPPLETYIGKSAMKNKIIKPNQK